MRWRAGALSVALLAVLSLPTTSAGPAEAFAGEPDDIRAGIQAIADEVDGQNVFDCIDEITKDAANNYRVMGTPTQDAFLQAYGNTFRDMGLESRIVPFEMGRRAYETEENVSGKNVIAVYPGMDPTTWVVIGGHYDTRPETAGGGGAHDNGSGLCTVKEYARVIAELKPDFVASVVFAWWDGEEYGLFGSRSFIEDHNATKEMLGVANQTPVTFIQGISIDMAGLVYPAHNPYESGSATPADPAVPQHFHLRAPPVTVDNDSWACFSSYDSCYEEMKERDDFDAVVAQNIAYRAIVAETAFVFQDLPPSNVSFEEDSYGRSDHAPFIAAGLPGLRIQGAHDSEYPCYHQPCDTLEYMENLAGSRELLVAGMDMETTTVAVISSYLGFRGVVAAPGDYPDGPPAAQGEGDEGAASPGAGLVLALAVLGSLVLARRRRD